MAIEKYEREFLEKKLLEKFTISQSSSVKILLHNLDEKYSLEVGTMLLILRGLLMKKAITIDLNNKIDFSKKVQDFILKVDEGRM